MKKKRTKSSTCPPPHEEVPETLPAWADAAAGFPFPVDRDLRSCGWTFLEYRGQERIWKYEDGTIGGVQAAIEHTLRARGFEKAKTQPHGCDQTIWQFLDTQTIMAESTAFESVASHARASRAAGFEKQKQ